MNIKRIYKGFTLAEVLITLGIIGIISAMTLPALMANYQKKVLTTQLQKAYSEISQAGAIAASQEISLDFRDTGAIRDGNFVSQHMKTIGLSVDQFPKYKLDDVEDFDLTDEVSGYEHYSCGIMQSGAYVCFTSTGSGILDINGANGPNTVGIDAFSIGFDKTGALSEDYSVYLRNVIHNDWDVTKYRHSDW